MPLLKWLTGEGRDYVHYTLRDEAQRLRFYPGGASEYHQAKRPQWPGLLERFDQALADLGAKFDASFQQTYAGHRAALLTALRTQSSQKKQQADARMGSPAEWAHLTRQFPRNARRLDLDFEDNPAEALTYFDRRYFNQHQPVAAAALKPALS